MRFYFLFIAARAAVVAQEFSVNLIKADLGFTDIGKEISSPASDLTSPSNEFSVQSGTDFLSDATDPALDPPAIKLTSYSALPVGSGIDGDGVDLNAGLSAFALDLLTHDDSLEANCDPNRSATSGKLRKRESVCKPRIDNFDNDHSEEDATDGVDPARNEKPTIQPAEEERTWREQNGRTSYKERSNPCSSDKYRSTPVCCAGPRVPNRELMDTGLRAVVCLQHCIEYLFGQPGCTDPTKRFCCLFLNKKIAIDRWGYWGADCVQMAA